MGGVLSAGCSLLFEPPERAPTCAASLEDDYLGELNRVDQDDPSLNEERTLIVFNRDDAIFQARREAACQPWGPVEPLGEEINSDADEGNPTLSRDGSVLYFSRDVGAHEDIFESRRAGGDWMPAAALPGTVNTEEREVDFFAVEGGRAYLTRGFRLHVGDVAGGFQRLGDLVPDRGSEIEAWVDEDERTLYLTARGSNAESSIYRLTRESRMEPFADPEQIELEPGVPASDPWVSGGILYYARGATGERFLRAAPVP